MRRWPFLAFASLVFSSALFADQTDARLDDLFGVLQTNTNLNTIRLTENEIWEIWLQHENADVMRLMALGIQRMNYQRYTDALVIFSQVIEHYPDYAEAWNKRATLYYLAGDLDASLADIERTLALEPRHFGALSGMGLVYVQRNELIKAREAFEALLRVHPHSPGAQENLKQVEESRRFNII